MLFRARTRERNVPKRHAGAAGPTRLHSLPPAKKSSRDQPPMRSMLRKIVTSQESGLVLVVLIVTVLLTVFAGSHLDRRSGELVNNFWNSHTLIQTATDASFFAIMAIGATLVIISGGIDLSVGCARCAWIRITIGS
jgi:ABC-type xylose transport system permease subunit